MHNPFANKNSAPAADAADAPATSTGASGASAPRATVADPATKRRRKAAEAAASLAGVALLVLVLACTMAFGDKSVPEEFPFGQADAVAAETMLTSPEGDGEGEGDESEESDEQQEESDTQQEDEQDAPEDQQQTEEGESQTQSQQQTDSDGSGDTPSSNSGGSGTGGSGTGTGGDGNGNGGNTEGEDDSPGLKSDLPTKHEAKPLLTRGDSDIPDDVFSFYAYAENPNYTVRVKLTNSSTPTNGSYLSSDNGRDYSATFVLGTNVITLYVQKDGKTVGRYSYQFIYQANKADADNPNVGDNPPTIVTDLDGYTDEITQSHFPFHVTATKYDGSPIYSSNITVELDGVEQKQPTGSTTFQYDLYFEPPVRGDTQTHTVSVLAWDDEGNSRLVSYQVTYRYVGEGEYTGTGYVYLDMTSVGLGVWGPYECDVLSGDYASDVVENALSGAGFVTKTNGTVDDGYYLARIQGNGIGSGAAIPDNLQERMNTDGIVMTGSSSQDSLGQYDFSQGSGWIYSVNGSSFEERGLSNYPVTGGVSITLYFTVAYGKDAGGTGTGGGGSLALSTYCGTWRNGTFTADHDFSTWVETQAPTCTEIGWGTWKCSHLNCEHTNSWSASGADPGEGDYGQTPVASLGHDYYVYQKLDAGPDYDGFCVYKCSRCGDEYTETIPATGGGEETEPDPGSGSEGEGGVEGVGVFAIPIARRRRRYVDSRPVPQPFDLFERSDPLCRSRSTCSNGAPAGRFPTKKDSLSRAHGQAVRLR